uniref:Transmembrane protein n=1 Tax=Lotharella globosa TaxID=91324 RepID=A0A6V3KE75_9EUKA|mmetsp:Transcript_13757/g.26996  ORF Transcript_13757/g.26996 Transcript_13757/m.26996 type:complete len:127 (+) Transcript_13757:39-419(+)
MAIVDGELVPSPPREDAKGEATEQSSSSSMCCFRRTSVNLKLGPAVPFMCCHLPVVILVLLGIAVGFYYDWDWRPVTLYMLQIVTISLLSFIPRREGYTYSGDQGPSTSGRPRQMSVRDLPARQRG